MLNCVAELFNQLGYGMRGFEDKVQTVWWLPVLLVTVFLLACTFCPKYGLLQPVTGNCIIFYKWVIVLLC